MTNSMKVDVQNGFELLWSNGLISDDQKTQYLERLEQI